MFPSFWELIYDNESHRSKNRDEICLIENSNRPLGVASGQRRANIDSDSIREQNHDVLRVAIPLNWNSGY
jgi:hypothetical protein